MGKINEIVGENQYLAEVILETAIEHNVTDILTKIRAIEGITIVTIRSAHVKINKNVYRSFLNIKYIPPVGKTSHSFLRRMHYDIMSIKGCKSFLVTSVEKIEEYVPFEKR